MYKTVLAVFGVTIALVSWARAQVPASQNQAISSHSANQNDPQAVATIEAAITAMGGREAWRQVGGATAQAVITPAETPERTVLWSDDWSRGRVRFRRDAAANEGAEHTLIGSDVSQVRISATGAPASLQRDNGIAVLATGYPAPALILSLSSRYDCAFRPGRAMNPRIARVEPDPDDIVITEQCSDPFYPNGVALLIWVFSKSTGLPKAAELPVWGQTHQLIRMQFISYLAFENMQGKLIPCRLQIKRASGSTDRLTVSKTNFVQSIVDSKFQTTK